MPPLKALELAKLARERLEPTLGSLGFKRTAKAGVASWCRPEGDRWLVMWIQQNPSNGALSAGYRFTLELQLGAEPKLYGHGFRRRFPSLLTAAERERLRHLDNQVVAKLPLPDMALIGQLPEPVREMVLAGWQPRTTPYGSGEHVWMRQAGHEDAEALFALIAEGLPAAIERFLALADTEPS